MTAFIQALLVLLLQSTGLLLLGLPALRLTRRHGPVLQTLIGRATLTGVALLLLLVPLTGHVKPVVRVALISPPAPNNGGAERPPEPILPQMQPSEPTPQQAATLPKGEGKEVQKAGASIQRAGASPAPTLRPPHWGGPLRSNLLQSKEVVLLALWLLVTSALLLWLAVCQRHLTRLRRAARPVTSGPAVDLLTALTPHPPRLLMHSSVHSPFLAGLRRPAIYLPMTYEADFETDALRAILTHEMAHQDRRDNAWTLAARLLTALLWPQPLLWLLCRRLEEISEDACDEAVLAQNCPPRAYAACLLSLAEHPLEYRQRALGAGVAPFRSSLGRRISRILAKGTYPMFTITTRLRLTAAALTLAAALGGTCLVSSAPAQTQEQLPKAQAAISAEDSRRKALGEQDMMNLKAISNALVKYEADHNYQHFPDADHWMDEILPYLSDPSVLYMPSSTTTRKYGYAFNRNCSKKMAQTVSYPNMTVVVFPSTLGTKNAADTGQSLRLISRANKPDTLVSYYAFADGHVAWYGQEIHPSFSLKGGKPTLSDAAMAPIRAKQKFLADTAQAMRLFQDNYNARFLAGLTPVQGPGVVVTLNDSKKPLPSKLPSGFAPPNLIHDTDINQVVNELKAAGAEAISVNDQRLVATSAVRTAGPTIFVNSTAQAPPYVIKAIGDSKTLAGALNLRGGIASQFKTFDPGMIRVQEAATLVLPAYTGTDTPRYARPVGLNGQSQALGKNVDTYIPKWNISINTEAQHKTDTKRQIIERQQSLRRVQTLIANLHEPIDVVVDTHVVR